MGITINLDGVETDRGPQYLREGTFNVKIIEANATVASTGTPQLFLRLECIDGDDKGSVATDYIAVTENTRWHVKRVFDAVRLDVPPGDFDLEPEPFLNKLCTITIRKEEFEGKDRHRVKNYAPYSKDGEYGF